MTLTNTQMQSITNYKRMGIEIQGGNGMPVIVKQTHLINGYILNQKQLIERAREVFPDDIIKPVVFSLDVDSINLEWIEARMDEFSIKRNDLIKQLAIDKSSLSLILSGQRELSKPMRATFFYYFLTFELNKDLREI